MSQIAVNKTYASGVVLTEDDLNNFCESIEDFFNTTLVSSDVIQNGGIDTAQIASNAITTSKLSSDGIGTVPFDDESVTLAKRDSVGEQSSSSSGSGVSLTGTSYAQITNISVSITTNGRPVMLQMLSSSSSSDSDTYRGGTGRQTMYVKFVRDSTDVAIYSYERLLPGPNRETYGIPPTAIRHVDRPAAGTYTYKVYVKTDWFQDTFNADYVKLMAYEL